MKIKTTQYYQISDADHPMYHSNTFEATPEGLALAREVVRKEYTECNKGNEHDKYWRGRNHNIELVTKTVEVIEYIPGNLEPVS